MVIRDKDIQRIYHVLLYCVRIRIALQKIGQDYDAFVSADKFVERDAVSFYLLQMGELTRSLTEPFKERHSELPWKQMRGLRNMVAHNYGHVDFEIIWSIVQEDIPLLEKSLRTILEQEISGFETLFMEELREEDLLR